ncbi:MAG: hypothetical protein ACJAVK_002247 [Akkermansiaceae bacterium]
MKRKIEIDLTNDTIKIPLRKLWGMAVETIVTVPDPIFN